MTKLLLITSILFSFLSLSAQSGRQALVIGNAKYVSGGTLKNPENDARDLSDKLRESGFEVSLYLNLDQAGMKKAIDEFGQKLKGAQVGVFFYAGHGIQSRGNNYLLPVDAQLQSENDIEYNCVNAGRILGKMEDAGTRTNIILLDACRNNPFERSWSRKTMGVGLTFMNAPAGTLIAYSTEPGKTASDGPFRNSPYTAALLRYMDKPNLKIEDFFKLVRIEVRKNTEGYQIPWESTSLEGNFFFTFLPDSDIQTDLPATAKQGFSLPEDLSEEPDSRQRMQDLERERKNEAALIRSLAVLPVANYTGDENKEFIASGIHDALISALGELDQIRVISKTSTLFYQDYKKTLSQIADELKVDGLIEGSLISSGENIRIQLKLFSILGEEQLIWTKVFSSEMKDILSLFDRVTSSIAKEIQITLSPAQNQTINESGQVNPKAYETYLIGRHYWNKFSPEDLKRSLDYFERAREYDPDFALAHIGISDAWYGLLQLGILPEGSSNPLEKVITPLKQARKLDPDCPEIYYTMGNLNANVFRDWNEAERNYKIALELRPNYADVYAAYSNLMAIVGRSEESIDYGAQGIRLDPYNPFIQLLNGISLYFARDFHQADSIFHSILEKDPNNFLLLNILPNCSHLMGNLEQEIIYWKQFITGFYSREGIDFSPITGIDPSQVSYETAVKQMAGFTEKYLQEIQFDKFNLGILYTLAEQPEKAIHFLEQAYKENNPNIPYLLNPIFDSIRSNPRFIALCKNLNLPLF